MSEKEFTEAILEKCIQFVFSLDDDQFELYRKYILQLHGQSEPRAFLNPKLQRNERSKASKLKRRTQRQLYLLWLQVVQCTWALITQIL